MTHYATLNGVKVPYTDQGEGLPLVFLHAFPLSHTMWTPQAEAFSGNYRVIRLDLRGHGEPEGDRRNFGLDDYADDVIALLDHLKVPRAVIIGLSMGGYTAFSIIRRHAARVQALVLADTRAPADDEDVRDVRITMADVTKKKGNGAIATLMLPKLLAPSTPQTNPGLTTLVREMILAAKPEWIVNDLMAMAARPDSTELLAQITCPTLVIIGEEDLATPMADSQFMADRIRNCTLAVIPKAGHLTNIEQPDAFNTALESFLKTLQP